MKFAEKVSIVSVVVIILVAFVIFMAVNIKAVCDSVNEPDTPHTNYYYCQNLQQYQGSSYFLKVGKDVIVHYLTGKHFE